MCQHNLPCSIVLPTACFPEGPSPHFTFCSFWRRRPRLEAVTEPPPQPPRSSQHISLSGKYNTLTYSRDRVSRGTMIKSTKYAISVRQKQKDSLASSKSLFDKGGATQRTRKSIYATAITARFFFGGGIYCDRQPGP